ncbi:MAG: zinc-binding alcohol dehydrogenase family protein [Chloroflexi bacterium]|jgi:2-desacetyl-2-hydroxyethyl bacteriochlorophyllide A dehydrogenase|uniref:Alcohol dehydrogenase n=1 Tax=Candidatus Thermofonsia Clade 3 bacterium TaxID=2364212 RepID=A0A2M8QGS2_9CHLR|nr:zinc-binding alcohol dehydrogenase family protein [Candidatus Roseilinea sp. NK_OTU-006]PJF49025.1 MAG: alcohol dehydrogenase [Candidatus Thermofonsia Clade 3 bacterium]RMG64367.1 MAG: zinc-binding alcohol dehydrogenase family protein [Chloroflexota bacterium]
MKVITLEAPGQFALGAAPSPGAPGPGEALVRVHRVGICGTDVHAYRGRMPYLAYPRILGHELGVEVIAVGDGVTNVRAGDRCAVEPYLNCGRCIACRAGKTNCCASLQVLGVHTDGGMRDQIIVPAHKLHPANDLSYEQLALVETLGIGAHAVARGHVQPDEWTLIIGAGPIGLTIIQFAQLITSRMIVIDVNPLRLDFVSAHFMVTHALRADDEPLSKIEAITHGDLPTVVFDATGNLESMVGAFRYVAHGGRLIFAGLVNADITFSDPFFHRREITLLATRNSTARDFQRILRLIREGRVDTRHWVTHRAPAEAMIGIFESWLRPENGVIKAMVEF